jgi:acetyl esterase/lipase
MQTVAVQGEPSQLDVVRALAERLHLGASEPENVTYREVNANGVPGIWVQPAKADNDFVLIHSHAGGGVTTSAAVDRKLVGHIATAIGAPALVLDFRLAPEHQYPAQVDDVESGFNWLLSQGYKAQNIISIGHSIGGYLAVALALRLRDAGKDMPGAIVSISPWADMVMGGGTIDSNAGTDKLLSRPLLEMFRDCLIGGTKFEPDDVLLNLNSADLSGLPPTFLTWGTYELFQGDSEVFAERLKAAGVTTEALPVTGAQHSYVWAAGREPEADRAIATMAAWVRSALPIAVR